MCHTNSLNHASMLRFTVERCWRCVAGAMFYNEISHSVYIEALGNAYDRNCQWIQGVAALYSLSKEYCSR